MRRATTAIATLLLAIALTPGVAAGDGLGFLGAAHHLDDAPYRYVALSPNTRHPLTVVERIDLRDSTIDRWWYLRGSWYLPAVAADGTAAGFADGKLVLTSSPRRYPPKRTGFAILDTRLFLRHPPTGQAPRHAVTRFSLRGAYGFDAISPDASTMYLIHNLFGRKRRGDYEVRALDTATGRLQPGAIVDPAEPDERMQGSPVSRVASADGRWAYTLYTGSKETFLHALDTVTGRAVCVDLPQLEDLREPFQLRLRLDEDSGEIVVRSRDTKDAGTRALLSIDTESFAVRRHGKNPFAFVHAFPGPGIRTKTIGHSTAGRRIELRQLGDPKWSGELLVFGCIHGDECAAGKVQPVSASLTAGCPDPNSDIYFIPNLDPDGETAGSRLNARGVDLNRNFPSQWQPLGSRWSPQYSGPHPFSEPETRFAAQVIRAVQPAATIWFHQYRGERPFVRAWGQSLAGGRHFARLARMPFRAMRWPVGTGPNWQNHLFPGAAFVVELPQGELVPRMESRLGTAIVRMGRWVRED
jgi:murein peptide amidase A